MFKDNFNLAYKNIKERLSRSVLTLLGVAIGIMAIISLMAIGEGMQEAVTGELSSLSDTIIVRAGEGISTANMGMGGGISVSEDDLEYLTERDIADMQRILGVKEVSTQLYGAAVARYNSENVDVFITGMDVEPMRLKYSREAFECGSLLNEIDRNKIVIGYDVAHEYFDTDIAIGSSLRINGKKFVVNGIFAKQGGGSIAPTDNAVLLMSGDFKKLMGECEVRSATVRVSDINDVESIAEEIEREINENHGEDDFVSATTMSSVLESIQNVIGIMQMVLLAIASIALVVASIGSMNTMLTSVMERTREIGIMKAIGAANKDVMLIFIIEGLLVSIIGGVFGILFGVFGSQAISTMLSGAGMGGGLTLVPVITLMSVCLAVGVSLLVGMLSSLYPAWKAARMSPIEAVRYE